MQRRAPRSGGAVRHVKMMRMPSGPKELYKLKRMRVPAPPSITSSNTTFDLEGGRGGTFNRVADDRVYK